MRVFLRTSSNTSSQSIASEFFILVTLLNLSSSLFMMHNLLSLMLFPANYANQEAP